MVRNRHLGIDEGAEAVRDLSLLHPDCADLDDMVGHGAESGGLDIEHHAGAVQILSPSVYHQLFDIVDEIALHPVDNLEIRGKLCMQGVRKGLDAAVVRHGQGIHSPGLRPLQDGAHIGDAVHIAHLGMTVELHPLYGADGQLSVKLVIVGHALDQDKLSLGEGRLHIRRTLLIGKHLDPDGVRKVGDIGHKEGGSRPQGHGLGEDDLSADGHHAQMSVQLIDRQRIVIKVAAVENVRILGADIGLPEGSLPLSVFPAVLLRSCLGRLLLSGLFILFCGTLFLLQGLFRPCR